MSKMKELSTILDSMAECGNTLVVSANALKELCENIVACGNTLQEAANTLRGLYSSIAETEPKAALPKKEPVKAIEPVKKYTLEEVRAILSAKSKAGFREDVKALITKHGSDNLTKLDPNEYESLVKDVEALSHE